MHAIMAACIGRQLWKCLRQKTHVFPADRVNAVLMSSNIHHARRAASSATPPKEELTPPKEEPTDLVSAMIAAAQDRRTAFDALIQREQEEYERGRRHLANMMGEDPETFTQEDVNRSIRYLFPSGLFEKRARPFMLPPTEYYPPQKAAQFDSSGRPFDTLFYTGKPNYFNLMHEAHAELNKVIDIEDSYLKRGILKPTAETLDVARSQWMDKSALESLIVEEISDTDYKKFIILLERIVQQPYAKEAEDYILRFRRELVAVLSREVIDPIQFEEKGRAFVKGHGTRKKAEAHVIVRDQGNGRVTINGDSFLDYFSLVQHRLQIMFPFHFVGMLNRFDLECTVRGGGKSGQSGAVRLATARALRSFVDESTVEKMRQAGLLTRDPRVKERKKPGQAGARKKFTWKKR